MGRDQKPARPRSQSQGARAVHPARARPVRRPLKAHHTMGLAHHHQGETMTTPAAKTTTEKPATTEKTDKLGGAEDLILLDGDDKPVEALSRDILDAATKAAKATPFRITHPKTGKTYERAGSDEDGRPTYRPS